MKTVDEPLPEPESKKTPAEEIASLRAKLADLQQEVQDLRSQTGTKKSKASTRSTRSESKTEDKARDVAERSVDEYQKLVRAGTLAYIEALRAYSDAASSFVDKLQDKNNPDDKDSLRDLTASLPNDIITSWVQAVDHTIDTPHRMMDKFQKSYDEADEIGESKRRKAS